MKERDPVNNIHITWHMVRFVFKSTGIRRVMVIGHTHTIAGYYKLHIIWYSKLFIKQLEQPQRLSVFAYKNLKL